MGRGDGIGSPQLVLVEWDDAKSESGWQDKEDAIKLVPEPCWTSGYLIVDKPTHVVVAGSYNSDNYGEPTCIPRGMVRRIVALEEGRETFVRSEGQPAAN